MTIPLDKVAVVVAFYNGGDCISDCLNSILHNGINPKMLFVVDNSDQCDYSHFFQRTFPNINVVRTAPRVGYGRACNAGASAAIRAGAEIVVLCNQDLILGPNSIEPLLYPFSTSERIAIAAPINWTHDLSSIEPFYIRHFLSSCPAMIEDALRGSIAKFYKVSNVIGSCMAVRVTAINSLGLFDEAYFMYMEDVDLCRRYTSAGISLVLCPQSNVGHKHSHTSKQHDGRFLLEMRKSIVRFELKNTNDSFTLCLLRMFRNTVLDTIRFITRFKLSSTIGVLLCDIGVLANIPTILAARRYERQLTSGMHSALNLNEETTF